MGLLEGREVAGHEDALLAAGVAEAFAGRLDVHEDELVCESVAAGLGVTLISRDAVARDIARGVLAELPAPGTPLRRDWCLVSREGHLPAPSALFVRHVRQAPGWAVLLSGCLCLHLPAPLAGGSQAGRAESGSWSRALRKELMT